MYSHKTYKDLKRYHQQQAVEHAPKELVEVLEKLYKKSPGLYTIGYVQNLAAAILHEAKEKRASAPTGWKARREFMSKKIRAWKEANPTALCPPPGGRQKRWDGYNYEYPREKSSDEWQQMIREADAEWKREVIGMERFITTMSPYMSKNFSNPEQLKEALTKVWGKLKEDMKDMFVKDAIPTQEQICTMMLMLFC